MSENQADTHLTLRLICWYVCAEINISTCQRGLILLLKAQTKVLKVQTRRGLYFDVHVTVLVSHYNGSNGIGSHRDEGRILMCIFTLRNLASVFLPCLRTHLAF